MNKFSYCLVFLEMLSTKHEWRYCMTIWSSTMFEIAKKEDSCLLIPGQTPEQLKAQAEAVT